MRAIAMRAIAMRAIAMRAIVMRAIAMRAVPPRQLGDQWSTSCRPVAGAAPGAPPPPPLLFLPPVSRALPGNVQYACGKRERRTFSVVHAYCTLPGNAPSLSAVEPRPRLGAGPGRRRRRRGSGSGAVAPFDPIRRLGAARFPLVTWHRAVCVRRTLYRPV